MASSKINLDEMDINYISANDLRKGSIVLLRDQFPCKVTDYAKAKTGKHGSAKIRVVGVDVLSGKKYDEIFQSSEQVCAPVVQKKDYDLMFVLDDGFLKLQSSDGSAREDLQLKGRKLSLAMDYPDEEMREKIEEAYFDGKNLQISVLCVMNREIIQSFKVIK